MKAAQIPLPWHSLSIRMALTVLLVLLAVGSQLVAYWQYHGLLTTTVQSQEIDKIQTIGSVIKRLIAQQSERLSEVTRLLALRASLPAEPALSEAERLTAIARVLDSAFGLADLDLLEVTDATEIIRYRAHDPDRQGDRATTWGIFEALNGTSQLVTSVDGGIVTIRAIEPLRTGTEITGTLTAGARLDERFLANLGREVGAQLVLLTRQNRDTGHGQPVIPHLDPEAAIEAFMQKIPVYRDVQRTHQTLVYLPVPIIDEAYVIVAQLDSSAAYALLDRGFWQSALLAGVILAGSLAIGLAALHLLLRPLVRLRRKAEQIAIDVTGRPVAAEGRNEVSSVVQTLELLTDRLLARNRELTETRDDIVAAKRSAEAASRAKSEFLATMSHEIRTPLNGVLGMTGLLAETKLDREQGSMVDTIRQSGEALLAVINDILDFSKIEAGRMDLEESEFGLVTLVESTVEIVAERAHQKRIEIAHFVAPEAIGFYYGDAGRIRQILLNLVSNAIKFTDSGTVAVEVTTDHNNGQTWLKFSVTDTGIGIPPQDLPKLFRHFTQLESVPARRYAGTGLGLAISRRLIEMMGGTIDVESIVGLGSRFWFTLPLRPSQRPGDQLDIRGPWDRDVFVLIVDDNDINRTILIRQLESWGIRSESVANAEAAVRRMQQAALGSHPFDAALLDYEMPGKTGLDLARQIKGDPLLSSVPLILLSSSGTTIPGNGRSIAALFRARLSKPVRQSLLYETICAVVNLPDPLPPPEPAEATEATEPGHTVAGRRLRILVAEDNPVNQQVMAGLVKRLGYHCDVVGDGTEAVRAVELVPYDLVLMDLHMPRTDGYEATRLIQALPSARARVPIIAVTASAFFSDRQKCLAAGMVDHIGKPVTLANLRAAIGRQFDCGAAAQPGAVRPATGAATGPATDPTLASAPSNVAAVGEPGPSIRDDLAEVIDALGAEQTAALLSAFRDRTTADLAVLGEAIDRQDRAAVKQAAHSIKGAATQLGLQELRGLAATLEDAAADAAWARVSSQIQRLEHTFRRTTAEIAGLIDTLDGTPDGATDDGPTGATPDDGGADDRADR